MTTLESLEAWRIDGTISDAQHAALVPIVSRARISLFAELNVLLYLGVLAFAGGLAWTASVYSDTWGDLAILLPATTLLVGCFAWCTRHVPPYAHTQVQAPGLVFDYVLYLGCLVFAVELGYIEYRFHLLQAQWDYYLLASAALYFIVAYRFDNRFVLSLGIATLGGWFGVRFSRFDLFVSEAVRITTLGYGILVAGLGIGLYGVGIKPHFVETYLHVAANVVLGALLAGVMVGAGSGVWFLGLAAACAGVIFLGAKHRRFAFVLYGLGYGYLGVSREVLRGIHDFTLMLFYIVVSAGAVVVGLIVLAQRFGREK
ncbi:MAG: DUF2157 domain-containing protein [Vicinamibacterales bacterium]